MSRLKVLPGRRSHLRFRTVGLLFLLTAGMFACWAQGTWADPQRPNRDAEHVAIMVQALIQRQHLSRHALDDEISQRCLDTFLKRLDIRKIYFYQSDIDEFMQARNLIDDQIKRGDTSFSHRIFTRFLQRVDERTLLVDELLSEKHDFTIDEEMIKDRDLLLYPKDKQEAHERWRKRIKFELLDRKSEKIDLAEAIEKVRRRHHSNQKRMHQTSGDELLEMYLTSLTTGFDPHSTYMSADTLENFDIAMKLELEGIGASLRSIDGDTVVEDIIAGGAADKHNMLKRKDKIVSVGQGEDGEMFEVVDMKLTNVVKLIRGKRGTIVRLGVIPVGKTERKIYTITRERIELKDKEARSEIIRKIEGTDGTMIQLRKADGTPFTVGWIDLPSFYMDMAGARAGRPDFKSTTRDVSRLLSDFRHKNVDAVVLDLRLNGGGALTEAVKLTGLFIDRGPVVQVKGPDGHVKPYDDGEIGTEWSGPLVVLVSRFSASASEIFAGAIQDYGRGVIVGDRSTHGKGTVQQLFDLGDVIGFEGHDFGALKMTIQQFYRPSGDSTQNRGVLADIELPSLSTHIENIGEADLDYAMKFDQIDEASHHHYELASSSLIEDLRKRSATRVSQSKDFADVQEKIRRYKEQVARKSVTLNEEKFMAEREELNADDEIEKQVKEHDQPVKHDFYFKEALAITLDYVDALNKNKIAQHQ